jgi:uncharacterized protein with HEPN domain
LREYKLYLIDIKEAIEKIEEYIKGISHTDFLESNKTIDAVVRNLEIIGEAARHIPVKIRQQYKGINWKDIVGMRNIVIHEYFGVDLDIVWKTIKERIPELKEKIKKILSS